MGLHGGARQGAGRPLGSGKFSEQTKPVRLPVSSVEKVMQFLDQKCLVIPKCTDKELLKYTDTRPVERWYFGDMRPKGELVALTITDVLANKDFKEGDILIVKRQAVPSPGDHIVVKNGDGTYAIDIMKDDYPTSLWGIIVYSIRSL